MNTKELFSSIDALDAEKFSSFLSEGASFVFGNQPAVNGRDDIKKVVAGFFSSINGLSHTITDEWEVDNTVICHGTVTYTRKDNTTLTVPFANILKMQGNLISEYLIYVDTSELFK